MSLGDLEASAARNFVLSRLEEEERASADSKKKDEKDILSLLDNFRGKIKASAPAREAGEEDADVQGPGDVGEGRFRTFYKSVLPHTHMKQGLRWTTMLADPRSWLRLDCSGNLSCGRCISN